jgi:hypothetical protein
VSVPQDIALKTEVKIDTFAFDEATGTALEGR